MAEITREKIKQYNKVGRIDKCIIEEKVDGSNFCWYFDGEKMRYFSRQYEIFLGTEKFFNKFIILIDEIHAKTPFEKGVKWFAEAVGMAQIKYEIKTEDTTEKLFVFDIKGLADRFYVRAYMEELCAEYGLKPTPITTLENRYSMINPNVLREGIIFRYEYLDVTGGQIVKLKWLQKNGDIKDKEASKYEMVAVK